MGFQPNHILFGKQGVFFLLKLYLNALKWSIYSLSYTQLSYEIVLSAWMFSLKNQQDFIISLCY